MNEEQGNIDRDRSMEHRKRTGIDEKLSKMKSLIKNLKSQV